MNLAQMTRRSSPAGIALPSLSSTKVEYNPDDIEEPAKLKRSFDGRENEKVARTRIAWMSSFQLTIAPALRFGGTPTIQSTSHERSNLDIAKYFDHYSIIKRFRHLMANEERLWIQCYFRKSMTNR
jgi:hypothetical protein